MVGLVRLITIFVLSFLLQGCGDDPLNNPYPSEPPDANTLYTAFTEQPKHLDLAQSYSENEWVITNQIYEPPLQYHYLKRPYTLEPLVAAKMPLVEQVVRQGQVFTIYTITIKPGIYYQPHPAFVKNQRGGYRYNPYPDTEPVPHVLSDLIYVDTRELISDDFIYQIKRLISPQAQSPIYSLMTEMIVDAHALDRYTYQITIKGAYPQFLHWLAMPFFAPLPWEVDQFYQQPLLIEHNITLDWYPVGTGPYQLIENDPNYRMVLLKNKQYHGVAPLIDKVIFSLEKEAIPYWNKFLQGYYDSSGVASDSFDQALQSSGGHRVNLTPEMEKQGIRFDSSVEPSIFYWGFNMLDAVVGGNSERAKKLRQAIGMVIDEAEYVDIFLNDQAIIAQNLIPEGIEGHETSVFKRSSETAKERLAEAGYPNGINPETGKPLVLYLDDIAGNGVDLKSEFIWIQKQFQKLGVELIIRASQYNRFQEKLKTGNMQLFKYGWHADYPDPENFLSLLYGPNAEAVFGGVNATNYQNPAYDQLFLWMKVTPPGPKRLMMITQLLEIIKEDMPLIARFYPKRYILSHGWMGPSIMNTLAHNTLKYKSLDPKARQKMREQWNQPIRWPFLILWGLCFLICIPGEIYYFRRTYLRPKLEKNE